MEIKFDLNSKKNNFEKYAHVESKLIIDTCLDLKPHVSIMIPTYKRPHLLKEAIDSAVGQKTDVIFEVVIVDNDADAEFSEELKELVGSYKSANIRYYRNEVNIGMFGNWNRCIELARSKRYTILNDDDLLHELYLKSMCNILQADSGISLLATNAIRFCSPTELNTVYKIDKSATCKVINVQSLLWGHFTNGALGTIFEKEPAISLGGYDEDLFPNADYFFAMKYCYTNKAILINNNSAYARWGDNESMKLNTIRGFIINDYQLWSDMIVILRNNNEMSWLSGCYYKFLSRVLTISKVRKYVSITEATTSELIEFIPFKVTRLTQYGDWFLNRLNLKILSLVKRYM